MSVLLSPAYYMAFLSRNATLECKILQYDYTGVWTECNMKVVLHPLYSMRLALIGCCDVIYTFHHSYDECFKGFQVHVSYDKVHIPWYYIVLFCSLLD